MSALEKQQTEHRGVYTCVFDDEYVEYTAAELSMASIPSVTDESGLRLTDKFVLPCTEKTYKHFDKSNVMHKYWASLYFAVYTMTGIGYGDITAQRHSETVVATLIMLSGAVFWA